MLTPDIRLLHFPPKITVHEQTPLTTKMIVTDGDGEASPQTRPAASRSVTSLPQTQKITFVYKHKYLATWMNDRLSIQTLH